MSSQNFKVFEVIQYHGERRFINARIVAVKDTKKEAQRVADTLNDLIDRTHAVEEVTVLIPLRN